MSGILSPKAPKMPAPPPAPPPPPTMDETMVAQTEADKLRSRRGRAAAILAGDQGGAVTTGTQKLLGY